MAKTTGRHSLGTAVIPGVRDGQRLHAAGYQPMGPLTATDGPRLPDIKGHEVERLLPWMEAGEAENLAGLLSAFSARARRILLSLLSGASLRRAAASGGIGESTLSNWRRVPEFDNAIEVAQVLGSARYEDELHDRALGGPDDRGSMRALELVVKARNADYRDKSQVQHGVVHVMAGVLRDAGGWRVNGAGETDRLGAG